MLAARQPGWSFTDQFSTVPTNLIFVARREFDSFTPRHPPERISHFSVAKQQHSQPVN
jgi:hypothetical protein